MSRQSRELRALKREAKEYRMLARHAGEELKDINEEMREFPAEYQGIAEVVSAMEDFNKPDISKEDLEGFTQLAQGVTGLVSAIERYNAASHKKQDAVIARAKAMGIRRYSPTTEELTQRAEERLQKIKERRIAREAPAEPVAIQMQPVPEFFGGGFYMVGSNTQQIAIYQISNTPMGLELRTGLLYA